jgi:hypothetical protein
MKDGAGVCWLRIGRRRVFIGEAAAFAVGLAKRNAHRRQFLALLLSRNPLLSSEFIGIRLARALPPDAPGGQATRVRKATPWQAYFSLLPTWETHD